MTRDPYMQPEPEPDMTPATVVLWDLVAHTGELLKPGEGRKQVNRACIQLSDEVMACLDSSRDEYEIREKLTKLFEAEKS